MSTTSTSNTPGSHEINDNEFLFFDSPPKEDLEKKAKQGIDWLFDNFDYERYTLQFKGKKPGETPDGINHFPVFVFTREERKKALETCLKFNRKNYDIYFMVNEGSGVTPDGKKVARCSDAVVSLSKCFIDTDNCPVKKVTAYLEDIGLTPHFIIETSPKRYHLYFFLEVADKTPGNILKWKAIQHMFHRLGNESIKDPSKALGLDSTMSDFSKILRVPGFMHVSKGCLVKVLGEEKDLPLYDLDTLFRDVRGQDYLSYNKETYGSVNPTHVPDLDSDEVFEAGSRFEALQSLSLHLANLNIPKKEKASIFRAFVLDRLDNSDESYAIGKKLTQKSVSLFESAVEKVKKEESVRVESIKVSADPDTAIPEVDPWHLPDSFYLSAPNGFGDIVKQAMSYARYPSAALSFGTFLTGMSILRAKKHLTPGGASPALYTINVAPTGYGKGDPMKFLQNTFASLGLSRLITNDVRSDRGLINHLADNNGLAICVLDEVAGIIQNIQDKKSATYYQGISKLFLQLYSTGSVKAHSFGKVASTGKGKKGEKEIIIDNPMLAVCGFTVEAAFKSLFTQESVEIGLFQRFIPVVPEIILIRPNLNSKPDGVITGDLFNSFIESITKGAPLELDDEGNLIVEEESPLETVAPPVPLTMMRYEVNAYNKFIELEWHYRQKYIAAIKDPDIAYTAGLYSRLAEQIERVATVLALEEVNLEILDYAIAFIESRHAATMATADKTFLKGEVGAKGMELERLILRTISKMGSDDDSGLISERKIFDKLRSKFPYKRDFDLVVNDLIQTGKIHSQLLPKKEGSRGPAQKGLSLGDVL